MSQLGAVVAAAVFVLSGAAVGLAVLRRCFPAWSGSSSVTVVVLVWLCWALLLGQALGAVGLLETGPLLAGAVASGVLALAWVRGDILDAGGVPRRGTLVRPSPQPRSPTSGTGRSTGTGGTGHGTGTDPDWCDRALTVATVALVGLVAAVWVARTVITVHGGINDPDSLGYHLPFMATFAHGATANQHRYLLPLYPVQFYPANDELLGAIALVLTKSFAFAALKNLVFGAFTLVAAHALGQVYRAGRLAVAATAVVLGFPVLAFSQPGEAVNDALMLLAVVGGLALLAQARDRPAPYVLALAAAGVALGVKFSAIVPAAALAALAVVLLVARVRPRQFAWAGLGLLASAAAGGSWYLRNAITYGNPVPPVRVSAGPLRLSSIDSYTGRLSYSVAHYLVQGRDLGVFAHGLTKALGPIGAVLAVAAVAVCALRLRGGDGFLRGVAVFVLVALLGYVTTPAGAAGLTTQIPYVFVVNLHYAAATLLAAALGAAVALAHFRLAWLFPLVGMVAVATSIGPGQRIALWSPQIGGLAFAVLVVAAGLAAAVAAVIAFGRPAWLVPASSATAGLVTAVLVTAGVAVAGVVVIARRYPTREQSDPIARWASQAGPARIGAWTSDVADLYGAGGRNQVVVLARLDHGGAVPIDTCQSWKAAVAAGGFQYTAVITGTAWVRWLRADPAFVMVAKSSATVVFQVMGPPDLACPGQVNTDADFWLQPGFGI